MPCHAACTSLKYTASRGVSGTPVDQVNFRKPLWLTRGRVNMMSPEITAKFQGLLNWNVREVLVSKRYHATLGNEKRKLVFTCVGESAKLNTANFGAKLRGNVRNIHLAIRQKVR